MRDILRKAKPQRLDDLIALNALYRPGPLRSGMVDDFIARKHGKVKVTYEVKELEPILADTYGVIAYQEQVMRIAQRAGRFHAGRGRPAAQGDGQEEGRGHGRRSAKKFVDGARRREGIEREEGDEDFRPDGALRRIRLQQVALDGVRAAGLSDGVSESELPMAFRRGAADDRGAEHRQARGVSGQECRERGIPVLPPDINKSQLAFTVTPEGVRFGLTAVKNVGEGAIASILGVRAAQGTIASLHALCDELDLRLVNKRVLESLVKAGAFDGVRHGKGERRSASCARA